MKMSQEPKCPICGQSSSTLPEHLTQHEITISLGKWLLQIDERIKKLEERSTAQNIIKEEKESNMKYGFPE